MFEKEYLSFEEYKEKQHFNIRSSFLGVNQEDRLKFSYKKYIYKTSLYKDCLLLYKDILMNFKKFYSNIPVENAFDLGILYTYFLLPNGIFSITDEFTYKKEKLIMETFNMAGMKVFSGYGVCRHIVKTFIDIAQTCDLEAYYVIAKCMDSNDHHALIGLILDNEKFALDPTNLYLGTFFKENREKTILLLDPFYPDNQKIYKQCFDNYWDKQCQKFLNYLNINQFYQKNSKMEVPFFEQFESMEKLYHEYQLDFEQFKKENLDNYQLVYQMSQKIGGYDAK